MEAAGLDPAAVIQIDVHLESSGGVDNLNWCQDIVPHVAHPHGHRVVRKGPPAGGGKRGALQ